MKRIIFTLVIAITSGITFMSCTEEEVQPSTNGYGTVPEDPITR